MDVLLLLMLVIGLLAFLGSEFSPKKRSPKEQLAQLLMDRSDPRWKALCVIGAEQPQVWQKIRKALNGDSQLLIDRQLRTFIHVFYKESEHLTHSRSAKSLAQLQAMATTTFDIAKDTLAGRALHE